MAVLSAFWSLDGDHDPSSHTRAMLPRDGAGGRVLEQRAGSVSLGVRTADAIQKALRSGAVTLIADARLTNRAQLSSALNLHWSDCSYATADTHLLLAAYGLWGERCVEHLLGEFAFVVWNAATHTLFAARDHTGQRPLFYAYDSSFAAICSTQQGLLRLPQLHPGFNEDKIVDYFTYSSRASHKTFFHSVHRLLPGHTLAITPRGCTRRTYWNPLDAGPTRMRRNEDYADALTRLVDTSTQACLPNEGPVATHLSAGLDSSTVTASAALLLAPSQRPVHAFTAVPQQGFAGTRIAWGLPDEGPAAAEVAALYPNIQHTCITSAGRDLMADVASLVDTACEPIAHAINYVWMLAILERARQFGGNVLLTGQAGNATISYEGRLALRGMFRQGHWLQLFSYAARLRAHREISIREAVEISFDGKLPGWAKRALIAPLNTSGEPGLAMLHPGLVQSQSLRQRALDTWFGGPGCIEDERRHYSANVDLGNIYNALQTLTGVETRDPTADKRLYDFCYSIPVEQFLVGGRTRSLVRRAMQQRLPAATTRRIVRGFQGADWHQTLSASMPHFRAELEQIEQSSAARHFLNLPYLRRLVETFPVQNPDTRQALETWNIDLTKGLAMGHFLRTFERTQAPHSVEAAPEFTSTLMLTA